MRDCTYCYLVCAFPQLDYESKDIMLFEATNGSKQILMNKLAYLG